MALKTFTAVSIASRHENLHFEIVILVRHIETRRLIWSRTPVETQGLPSPSSVFQQIRLYEFGTRLAPTWCTILARLALHPRITLELPTHAFCSESLIKLVVTTG